MRMWVFRFPFSVNFLPQPWCGHMKGFRPVYEEFFVKIWVVRTYVSPHVDFQSAGPGIALATDVALERLFTGVNQLVSL